MWEDPIVKETRAAREELFSRFNYDLAAFCEYLRKKEREHSSRVITREPRRPEPVDTLEKLTRSPSGGNQETPCSTQPFLKR